MDSNHELDRILKSRNLLILQSRRSREKHQKQVSGTKSVQKVFSDEQLLFTRRLLFPEWTVRRMDYFAVISTVDRMRFGIQSTSEEH